MVMIDMCEKEEWDSKKNFTEMATAYSKGTAGILLPTITSSHPQSSHPLMQLWGPKTAVLNSALCISAITSWSG